MTSKMGSFILFLFLFISCISNPVFIEQKQITETEVVSSPAFARECGIVLLYLIPIDVNDRYSRAYAKLVEQAKDGGVLTEIRIQESWYYQFLGTKYCTTFTAKVIRGISK
ncbi:hypothetical protein A0128_12540 [Leptospira tipperaryensis]|uniref:Lipoprotein n=1 Tax=Leptospira tipperaryensis TaxID=2564040 RepID=A0A1D7UYD6_9LEPT|nr:hypothetical protein [Leptospira tipperaryensis]AOP34603.1 hypothetical protein A0128_12540 [Leptospira tipperaryensis]